MVLQKIKIFVQLVFRDYLVYVVSVGWISSIFTGDQDVPGGKQVNMYYFKILLQRI